MYEPPAVKSFVILGVTRAGRPFRPSDWAERLCGVMSGFRPPGRSADVRLTWSPYVRPEFRGGVRCVRVDASLYDLDPMAYGFVAHFAADNDLQVVDES